ncbi:peptidoglycan-binding protein [Candidatus Jorgensenbacteria bacterium]|nr:peptidoglycan-binding protein [Candidatus Jorgensenbacteria bacterium]
MKIQLKLKYFMVIAMAVTVSSFLLMGTVNAQSNPSNVESQLNRIRELTKQIESLKAQMAAAKTERKESTSKLIAFLREGSKGDSVKTLQAILSLDSEIYPEGLITGFYGKATAKAVKRFQKKHDLDQVGLIGPNTLEKLNKALEKHPLSIEADNDDKRPCAIVPPGHLIAPGWLRKHGGERPIVPLCQTLPPGIAKKLNFPTSTSTSTPDVTAPTIYNVTVATQTNSATIHWMTNENATSRVFYGGTAAYTVSSTFDPTLVINHAVTISGLTASTTYHFQVESKDTTGNTATSSDYVFTTTALPDTTAPTISNITLTNITSSSAAIGWTTNESSTAKIYYSTTTPLIFVSTSTLTQSGGTEATTTHGIALTGLNASTTYYFIAEAKDVVGNIATSTQNSFSTVQ